MIKLSFHGACREVTGSCSLLEWDGHKILIDCGLFQGERFALERNHEDFHFNPAELDVVFLTHAHLDHCGRLPKLYKDGFRGKVYATDATRDLAELMLLDAAHIIAGEAEMSASEPLYTEADVAGLMPLFETLPYHESTAIFPGLKVMLYDAGHILGSAMFQFFINDEGTEKKIVFSGDLGNSPSPIVRNLDFISGTDVLICESTYAGSVHENKEEGIAKIQKAILETASRGGNLIIPIFALEKTQEILFELNYLVENKLVPKLPIFLDSPLAIKALAVYRQYEKYYNQKSLDLIRSGDDLFNFPGLKLTPSSAESKAINGALPPNIILASSGMGVGGRVPYHLKFNLEGPRNQVLLVAYQAPGTPGRALLRGDKQVSIMNERVRVRAKIALTNAFSSHADENQVVDYIKHFVSPQPSRIFLNHGEDENALELSAKLSREFKLRAEVPQYGMIYDF
ncbi:MAG TPA: MBL fold metallo-hydrolase [bacterium]|nr:MBL fold metallo-hydrolase [bacterium]HPT29629.1 MBL fold metallo-hydrolase [bacterium]